LKVDIITGSAALSFGSVAESSGICMNVTSLFQKSYERAAAARVDM
jgi:hypothetical protein